MEKRYPIKLLFSLFGFLKRKRKIQLLLTIFVMIINSILEVVSIASIFPILVLLTGDKNSLESNETVKIIMNFFKINNSDNFLPMMLIAFILVIIFSSIIRLFNLWLCSKLPALIGSDFSCDAYRKALYQPYMVHMNRNSSEIISTCTIEIDQTIGVINTFLQLITSLFIVITIFSSLLFFNWEFAIGISFILFAIYYFIGFKVKKSLRNNSQLMTRAVQDQIKSINEALGSIREVILNNSQSLYLNVYKKSDIPLRDLQAKTRFIAGFPKFVIESISIILLIIISFYIKERIGNRNLVLPSLGIIAFSLQKMLPAIQNIYSCWAIIQAKSDSVRKTLGMLNQSVLIEDSFNISRKLEFKNSIKFQNVSFGYDNKKNILSNINLVINKGEILGIKGVTGSGKTTLINILMGLLKPTKGNLLVDNLNISERNKKELIQVWMKKISLVPQDIFLNDNSFAENIAFGVPKNKIKENLVRESAKKALIHSFIKNTERGYRTFVGERGVKLSGGQKQRIAIARALYKESDLIVLDEATSALDTITEMNIINSINKLDKKLTIVMIAHRLSTLDICDRVITIKEGKLIQED